MSSTSDEYDEGAGTLASESLATCRAPLCDSHELLSAIGRRGTAGRSRRGSLPLLGVALIAEREREREAQREEREREREERERERELRVDRDCSSSCGGGCRFRNSFEDKIVGLRRRRETATASAREVCRSVRATRRFIEAAGGCGRTPVLLSGLGLACATRSGRSLCSNQRGGGRGDLRKRTSREVCWKGRNKGATCARCTRTRSRSVR